MSLLSFGVFMIYFFQIGDGRLEIQLRQLNILTPAFFLDLSNLAFFIQDVAKCNRISRTGLLAGGLDLVILHVPSLIFGQIFHLPDAMVTKRTLFHHTFAAHRNSRIQLHVQWARELITPPVETSLFIDAIV